MGLPMGEVDQIYYGLASPQRNRIVFSDNLIGVSNLIFEEDKQKIKSRSLIYLFILKITQFPSLREIIWEAP